MTKQIPLTQDKVALVDDADFQHFNQWKWRAVKGKADKWYAVRWETGVKDRKLIIMHREIMSAPDNIDVDHRDNDGLNNQRYNLRFCTNTQNQRNKGISVRNTSGYKGVSKIGKRWWARLEKGGRFVFSESFSTPEEAARAYDKAATKHFGEFAKLNFEV